MAQAPISPGPRKEAGALAPARLTAPQLAALDRLLDLVAGLHGSAMEEADPNDEPYLARIEPDRRSNTILIDGPRGTGKTSLLLTAIAGWLGSWTRPTHGRPRVRAGDPPKPAVLPLPILDLSTLEPGVTLDLMLAARLRALVTALDAGEGSGNKDPACSLEDRWDTFVELAAGQGAGRLGQSSATALERAEDLRQLATNGVHRAERLGELMRAVRAAAQRQWGVDLMIVVTVDDADVQPTRADELLRTLRVLHHPRLAFLVAGDIELFHHAVCNKLRAGLPKVDDSFYLSRLSAQVLERIFPVDQRLGVRHLSPAERLRLLAGASTDDAATGRSLADLLKLVPRNFMDPWDELFADADLELWKALPDRVRTLVDLQLALQRQVIKDPKVPGKQIIPPWAALRCLWEASIDLRESDPSARDHLRRSLDLYWENKGAAPKLRLWDFTITWEYRDLTRFPVDEPRDALMARSIVIRIPDRPVLRFKNGQRAHALSESLAWLMVFSADVAVDCGWMAKAEVEQFWPKEAWVSCHARRDDGPDDVFDWPNLNLEGYHVGTGLLRTLLMRSLANRDLKKDNLTALAEAYAVCRSNALNAFPRQSIDSLMQQTWVEPRKALHPDTTTSMTDEIMQPAYGFAISADWAEWNRRETRLEVFLRENIRTPTNHLISQAIARWRGGYGRPTPSVLDHRLEIGERFGVVWEGEPFSLNANSLARTIITSETLKQAAIRSSSALWVHLSSAPTNEGLQPIWLEIPHLAAMLPRSEQNCTIEIQLDLTVGPNLTPSIARISNPEAANPSPDAVLIAILHESGRKSNTDFPLPWVPRLKFSTTTHGSTWPVPGLATILWPLSLADSWNRFRLAMQNNTLSKSRHAIDWVRSITLWFTLGSMPDNLPDAHDWGDKAAKVPHDWEHLSLYIKSVSPTSDRTPCLLDPTQNTSWDHFKKGMARLADPSEEHGLPPEDCAIIAAHFPPPKADAPK